MVHIDITYAGALRTEALHGPSGSQLTTDAPLDNQGRGESFSPTDLVATALGACMLTIMGIVAEREGLDLAGAHVHVKKVMVTGPVRRIGALEVEVTVPVDPGEAARRKLQQAAETCPVRASLGSEIDIPIRYRFGAPAEA
ncbi:MAG: OsmC family protein [Planctomycetota bacterium]